jgi:hypothetical protein
MERRSLSKRVTSTTEFKPAFTVNQSAITNAEEARVFKKLLPTLREVRKHNKLIGYTMKNSTQAVADVDNPKELSDLALLASQLFKTSAKLLSVINQASIKSLVLEGSGMQILCLAIKGNQISLFIEKTVDYSRILEKLAETVV